MKRISFFNLVLLTFLISCNPKVNENENLDNDQILKEVQSTEQNLFELLKEGKIDQAFSLHDNNPNYKNISEGYTRTYEQMDSTLKANSIKGIKSYDYEFNNRDFMVFDNNNALETLEGNKIIKGNSDSTIEKRAIIMTLLWTRFENKWKLRYLHSSYKN